MKKIITVTAFAIALGALACLYVSRQQNGGEILESVSRGNTRISSFGKAKRLARMVYEEHERTLYCDCPYADDLVVFANCAYVPRNDKPSSAKLQWEHVVPAEMFGSSFREWREGHMSCLDRKGKKFRGRNCLRKISQEFRLIEADLYNIWPESAELNKRRSNKPMGMVSGENREFGACDMEIGEGVVEVRPRIRGDVARTYFYMESSYPRRVMLSKSLRHLLETWNKDDPPDAWECERARRIQNIQSNANVFVVCN